MAKTEKEFADSIDCRFSYDDEPAWKKIIHDALAISSNASFMVLHEICRAPRSSAVTPVMQKRIFEYWRGYFSHPLVPIVSKAAIALIEGAELSVSDALDAMTAIAKYSGEYSALAIVYFSCDDTEGKAGELYESIAQRWRAAH